MRHWFSLLIICCVTVGAAAAVAIYTFVYAKGYSYLGSDSAACANCHIMQDQFNAWQKSSHRIAAQCNDCHAPHDLVGKYYTKALNGFMHSYAFTTGWFHDPIQIKGYNRRVTEQACRSCHENLTHAIEAHNSNENQQTQCTRCHSTVGHDN